MYQNAVISISSQGDMLLMPISKIIIFPELKNSIIEKKDKRTAAVDLYIYGKILSEESICQLISLDEKDNRALSVFQQRVIHKIGKISFTFPQLTSSTPLPSLIEFEIDNSIKFTLSFDELITKRRIISQGQQLINNNNNTKNEHLELEIIISDFSRIYTRIDGLLGYPLSLLNIKKIAIVGLGSGGSLIALSLAKAGIKNFLFIDDDIYEDHNIIRHICSLNDLGRYKTLAVRDYLLERIPDLNISTIEENFSIDTQLDEDCYRSNLKDFDLLISATGDHKINFRINQFAYRFGIPVIYAGTFNKITGGIMIRVDPTKGDICYNCIYGSSSSNNRAEYHQFATNIASNSDNKTTNNNNNDNDGKIPNIIASEQSITYDRNLEDLLSQPGLGIDIDNITIFVVKFVLCNLLENLCNPIIRSANNNNTFNIYTQNSNNKEYATLYNFPYPIYVWYNRDIPAADENNKIYKEGLELYYYGNSEMSNYINKRKDCPVCGIDLQR